MGNLLKKKVKLYNVKEGTLLTSDLYGQGKVIKAYAQEGCADIKFSDGHVEYGCDITNVVVPQVVEVEAFKCPLDNSEMPLHKCAYGKDGISGCAFFKVNAEKNTGDCVCDSSMQEESQEKWNDYSLEEEKENLYKKKIDEVNTQMSNILASATIEDVLGNVSITAKDDLDTFVVHKRTGSKGKILEKVACNAVVVQWKNPDAKTVNQIDEIEKDNSVALFYKLKDKQEKLNKKTVKPVSDFFKKEPKAAQVKDTTAEMLKIIATMPLYKKEVYAYTLEQQLAQKGLVLDLNSIRINANGDVDAFTVNKLNTEDDFIAETLPLDSANKIAAELGYTGDILKVYATLKNQLQPTMYGSGYSTNASDAHQTATLSKLFD